MTAADEMRADIEQAKDEIKGIMKRFTDKFGYMDIEIIANQYIVNILNNKRIYETHVNITVKI